jgi:hypothetical protein
LSLNFLFLPCFFLRVSFSWTCKVSLSSTFVSIRSVLTLYPPESTVYSFTSASLITPIHLLEPNYTIWLQYLVQQFINLHLII